MKSRPVLILILFLISSSYSQTVYVSSEHWVYEYLERLEAKHLLPFVLNSTKPMTRDEIAGLLKSAYQNKEKLNRVEQDQLQFLLGEFREELVDIYSRRETTLGRITGSKWIDPVLPDLIYANGRNLLSISSGPLRVNWDPILFRKRLYANADTLSGGERVFEDSNGFVFWGTIGDNVGFYTNVRDTREWGTRLYPGYVNTTAVGLGFVQGGGDQIYHDETRAYVVLNYKTFYLQFGKDKNLWGPGYSGQLGLSGRATSYDFAKLQVVSQRFKFTSLWGVLQHYDTGFFYGNHQEKYIAAHRLECAPFDFMELGLYETLIYSGRKIEPGYLNPVMFYRSAEHYLGDRDNAAMGLDVELKLIPNTKIYGELFIDDLTTGKLSSGFYGNKFAYLVGGHYVDMAGIPNLDVRLEYARVRPYTYSHKFELNSYRHFITGLGHWIGPNADDLYLELAYRYSRRLKIFLYFEVLRHGANQDSVNYGGSIFAPHRFGDSETVHFLDGILEKTKSTGVNVSYELAREFFIKLQYNYFWGQFDAPEKQDYPGNRSEFWLQFSLNY
ncbi:hypothetical protein JXQ31_13785 [candidate division KSB1 bacterium]|nr:hypothetical protein [candidate division KSB1 bacterium]